MLVCRFRHEANNVYIVHYEYKIFVALWSYQGLRIHTWKMNTKIFLRNKRAQTSAYNI